MNNRQWNREFPDVPDYVHQTVLDTLAGLDGEEEEYGENVTRTGNMKKIKLRTVFILAAAFVIVVGTTAAAAQLFRWNQKATEVFEAEPQLQGKLAQENIAVEEHQSASGNGLTITAIQTIQDSNCFYALFQVTAEDSDLFIDENCGMDYQIDFRGREDPFIAKTWGFVENSRQETGHSRYFEIFGTKMEAEASDMEIGIRFTALTGPGQKAMKGDALITGNWDFDLNIHPAQSRHIDINREFLISGCNVRVESADISPLTCKITCSGDDIRALAEKEGVNFDQADVLLATSVTGVKYEDGTVASQNTSGPLCLWEHMPGEGSYEKLIRFDRVVEPERAAAILVGPNGDEVLLQ